MQVQRNAEAGDAAVDRHELRSVEWLCVRVREELEALEAEVVHAAFGLRDGPVRVAEPQASHRCELARVLLDDAGEEIVDADGPIVGLGAAEELRAGDAVGEHGEVHAHVLHRRELGLDVAVSGRGDDAVRR